MIEVDSGNSDNVITSQQVFISAEVAENDQESIAPSASCSNKLRSTRH